MWDEEKFFKDFAEESESIKPDKEFVDKLKRTARDSNEVIREQRRRNRKVIHSTAIAASLILCFTVGLVMWRDFGKPSGEKDTEKIITQDNTGGIYAGKDDKGIYIGTIGEQSELELAIELLEDDDTRVMDKAGESVSEHDKESILAILNSSKKVNETEKSEELKKAESGENYESYELNGTAQKLSIRLYASGYVVINDNVLYKADMPD